eukprot:18709-Heterococcus_DN1.PRE.4
MDSDERAESKGESKGDFEDAKAASSESKSTDEDIVDKVSKYFYENEDFAAKFETFVNEHANEAVQKHPRNIAQTFQSQCDLVLCCCVEPADPLPSSLQQLMQYTTYISVRQYVSSLLISASRPDNDVSSSAEQLEEYIKAQGSSVLAFYDAIRTASERDPLSSEAIFGQIMAATADFDIFMQLAAMQYPVLLRQSSAINM